MSARSFPTRDYAHLGLPYYLAQACCSPRVTGIKDLQQVCWFHAFRETISCLSRCGCPVNPVCRWRIDFTCAAAIVIKYSTK